MINRRTVLKRGALAGLAGASTLYPVARAEIPWQNNPLPTDVGAAVPALAAPKALLDAAIHPKFVTGLPNPNVPAYRFNALDAAGTQYELHMREFSAQIGLVSPTGQALTTVLWGYGTPTQAPTSPGRTFSVKTGSSITVTYVNEMMRRGRPIAHRLPIDTTLGWANPGNLGGMAPVPLVQHRHGGVQDSYSDGLPNAWVTPDANADGVPDYVGNRLWSQPYLYENKQEAGHVWYHDHAMGVTRLNVFMGMAGHYFIRDDNEAYLVNNRMLPAEVYEIPVVIQDRMFDTTGKLFYPSSDPANPTAPPVTHLPEFFGDFIIVNGVPWPKCDVEPRSYRLRLLNGSDSRFYNLQFKRAGGSFLPFHQVGTELGMMDAPVRLTSLVLAPGERADIVVNFRMLRGRSVTVINTAATPFPNGAAATPSASQIVQFNVSLPLDKTVPDIRLPAFLRPLNGPLPAVNTAGVAVRKLLLLEGSDPYGRLQTMLGTVNPVAGNPSSPAHGTFFYSDPVTERVAVGSTEIWEFHNTTVDAHPIHLHLVDFRVVDRQPFTGTVVPKPMGANGSYTGGWLTDVQLSGSARPCEPNEAGRKDTVVCYPGEVTRVLVTFPRVGRYVWHCHILSHEDHEMMRRFIVA